MVRKRSIKPILSRALKDKKIIELYEEGYPVSEIVSRVHASPNTVTDRIKQYNKSKEPQVVSARAQAFVLFKKSKKSNTQVDLVDVAAKLDLSADETQNFYADFQRLEGLNEYVMLNFKTEGDINYYLDFYKECQALKITPATAMEALPMARSAASIEKQRETSAQELKDIQRSILNAKEIRNFLRKDNENLKYENGILQMDKCNLENDISELKRVEKEYKDSEFHETVRKIATEEATHILGNKSIDRIEARVAIAKVIRQNPELLPVLCPPSDGYYDCDLERKFKALFEKSMDEGHREYMMMILPSVVTKLCAGIDEYNKNNKKQEGGTTGENSKSIQLN